MGSEISATIGYLFYDFEEPQMERAKQHKLNDILVIGMYAFISNMDN